MKTVLSALPHFPMHGSTAHIPSDDHPPKRGWVFWLAIPLAILVWQLFHRLDGPLDHDEIYWIGGSCHLADLVTSRPLSDPSWGWGPIREHPQLGRILVGMLLRSTGGCDRGEELLAVFYERHRLNPANDTRVFPERTVLPENPIPKLNDARKAEFRAGVPWIDPDLLYRARLISGCFGALAIAGIFLIGARLTSTRAGVIAASAFALHPIAAGCYTTALMDITAQAFAILFFLSVMQLADKQLDSDHRIFTPLVTSAVLLTLALGSKLITLPVPAAVVIAAIVFHIQGKRLGLPHYLLLRDALTAVLGIGTLLFILSNAALYREPVSGFVALVHVQRRLEETAEYMRLLSGTDLYLRTLSARFLAAARGGFGAPGTVLIFIAGAALGWMRCRNAPIVLLVSWWVATFFVVAVSIPFPWYRYFLPLLPPAVLILASTVELLAARVSQKHI